MSMFTESTSDPSTLLQKYPEMMGLAEGQAERTLPPYEEMQKYFDDDMALVNPTDLKMPMTLLHNLFRFVGKHPECMSQFSQFMENSLYHRLKILKFLKEAFGKQ